MVLGAFVLMIAGCSPRSVNTPMNTQIVNSATAASTPPTADSLLALDGQATEAYFRGDAKYFEGMLNDKFVMLARRINRVWIKPPQ